MASTVSPTPPPSAAPSSTISRKQGHKEVASASLVPAQRPDAAVHQRRDEPVQGLLHRQGAAALPARHHRAEVRARRRQAQRPRERRPHRAPPHLLRDAGQLLVRRLLQARRDRLRLRAADQGLRASIPSASSTPCTNPTTRRAACGRRSPASATTASSRLGDKDNFWAMGETGPCGPCSEIHFLQGDDIPCAEEAAGRSCQGPPATAIAGSRSGTWCSCSSSRSARAIAARCPSRRSTPAWASSACAPCCSGVRSNYETDLLRPLIAHAEKLSGKTFDPSDYAGTSVSLRAIADHARAAAFLIADGVFPDKTGREYVLRRIMRRGIYHGWLLGIKAAVPARDRRRRDRDDGRRLPGAERTREPDRQDLPRRGDALPRDARSRRAHPDRRDARARARRPSPASSRSSCTTPTASRST